LVSITFFPYFKKKVSTYHKTGQGARPNQSPQNPNAEEEVTPFPVPHECGFGHRFVGVLDVGFDAVVDGDFGILAFCEPTPKET